MDIQKILIIKLNELDVKIAFLLTFLLAINFVIDNQFILCKVFLRASAQGMAICKIMQFLLNDSRWSRSSLKKKSFM